MPLRDSGLLGVWGFGSCRGFVCFCGFRGLVVSGFWGGFGAWRLGNLGVEGVGGFGGFGSFDVLMFRVWGVRCGV